MAEFDYWNKRFKNKVLGEIKGRSMNIGLDERDEEAKKVLTS